MFMTIGGMTFLGPPNMTFAQKRGVASNTPNLQICGPTIQILQTKRRGEGVKKNSKILLKLHMEAPFGCVAVSVSTKGVTFLDVRRAALAAHTT